MIIASATSPVSEDSVRKASADSDVESRSRSGLASRSYTWR